MPEATVYKNGLFPTHVANIRSARKIPSVQSVSRVAEFAADESDDFFWLSIFGANRAHVGASLSHRKIVGHSRLLAKHLGKELGMEPSLGHGYRLGGATLRFCFVEEPPRPSILQIVPHPYRVLLRECAAQVT